MSKILFTSFYQDRNPERHKELEHCIRMNVNNAHIDKIVVVLEGKRENFPVLNYSDRIEVIEAQRPTFRQFFELANLYCGPDDIAIISNTDIYFDGSLKDLDRINWTSTCLALSRWHYQNGGNIVLHNEKYSQDVWIFKGKIRQMQYADFYMGIAGCLSGDTIVNYNRGKRLSTRKITIKELHDKLKGNGIGKGFDLSLPTHLLSLNSEGRIFNNKVIEVFESGIKPTFKITLDDNTQLIATADHPIFVNKTCYIAVENLRVGDEVLVKGNCKQIKTGTKRHKKRTWVYVKYHPEGQVMKLKGHFYIRKFKSRLVMEAHLNGLPYEEFINHLNTKSELCKSFRFLSKDEEIHHIDENPLNDELSNLELLSSSEHARRHGYERGRNKNYTEKKKIISIKPHNEIMTYDIRMESPAHNFVANSMIVHNCDNRIAYEILQAGYHVINPSQTIRCIHYHMSEVRNYSPDERIPKPYYPVPVVAL